MGGDFGMHTIFQFSHFSPAVSVFAFIFSGRSYGALILRLVILFYKQIAPLGLKINRQKSSRGATRSAAGLKKTFAPIMNIQTTSRTGIFWQKIGPLFRKGLFL
jgi:hypothetical protein